MDAIVMGDAGLQHLLENYLEVTKRGEKDGWIQPVLSTRLSTSGIYLFPGMMRTSFPVLSNMSVASFKDLLDAVSDEIKKTNTNDKHEDEYTPSLDNIMDIRLDRLED